LAANVERPKLADTGSLPSERGGAQHLTRHLFVTVTLGYIFLEKATIERRPGERRQGDPGYLAPFSDDLDPMVAARVGLDIAESRTHQFACAQARRIAEVQKA
jgi:hypothetical protein